MRTFLSLLAVFACSPLLMIAGVTFPDVGPEAWAVGDAATQGKGAIYLDMQIRVYPSYVEYRERIRIASDAGKEAVEFPTFSSSCYDIQGRTVYPDGRIAPFTQKDMLTKTQVKVGSSEVDRQVVVVPGVTGNCVVDLTWKQAEPFNDPNYYGFGAVRPIAISGSYPVKQAEIGISRSLSWNWGFRTGYAKLVKNDTKDGMTVLTLADVPAEQAPPFSLAAVRTITELTVYPVPMALYEDSRRGQDAYWNAVGHFLKDYFEKGVERGRAYSALARTLLENLTGSPVDRAIVLMKRLDGTIRNTSYPTFEEESRITKKQAKAEIDSKDLGAAAKRGSTDATGMAFLFRALLEDAGLKPIVAMAENRNSGIFNPKLKCYQQFDEFLIGVPAENGTVTWFSPGRRFFAPGLVPQSYQGSWAMKFDPKTWEAKTFNLSTQAAAVNQIHYDYTLELNADEDHFKVQASFSGLPEYDERMTYMALEPKEQDRALSERLAKTFKTATFSQVHVQDATNAARNISWTAEGVIDREPSRRRRVDPFPTNTWPMWIPDRLDDSRQDAITLPYAFSYQATSRFRIPKGHTLAKVEPISQSNLFGKVSWSLERKPSDDGDTCTVTVLVELQKPIGIATEYGALKAFLGWEREALERTLILEKL